ncbi:hypothetical protein [Sphingomonas sp. 8AM]|uniref:hypothetical protein n=1 Tax=Sphingomonas sp. 8AM TaxID=2653170 RepID=UPI001F238450|nr:hypothetical protein [Sphingomonas sp. 8AM]
MARALTLDLEPCLHALLTDRIGSLVTANHDLTDQTEFLVIEPGDTEEDVIRAVGFSPLVEPIDGLRFGEPGFYSWWDWLANREGWFEMIVTFGSVFAHVLLISHHNHPYARLCSQFCPSS